MTRQEWEYMCERLKLIPDTLCQVDRYGRIIGGPWRFLDAKSSQEALNKIIDFMREDGRLGPGPDNSTVDKMP